MSNKKQEKIKQARNSLELSSIETAIDCPIGTSTSQPEKGGDISRLAASVSKPKDSHDETDFLAAASSLSGLHASIETLVNTTELLMKLEKHLGLGKNRIGSNDDKNKKQGHSPLFEKIWNILKIIVWIICAYIIIRSFIFSGESQPPIQNSKILGEKSVIINNIPQSAQSMPAILNSMQRNDSQEFDSLLKLTQSLKMLLANLKLDEVVEEEEAEAETSEHQHPSIVEKIKENLNEKLPDGKLKKAAHTSPKYYLKKETNPTLSDSQFGKGKTSDSILFQSNFRENNESNTSSEIPETLSERFAPKTKSSVVDFSSSRDDINVPTSTTYMRTTESIVSSSTAFFTSSTSDFYKSGEEEGEQQSEIPTAWQHVTEKEVVVVHNDVVEDNDTYKGGIAEQKSELGKVEMSGFLNFLSTPTSARSKTRADVFYKNETENSTLIGNYSDNSMDAGVKIDFF